MYRLQAIEFLRKFSGSSEVFDFYIRRMFDSHPTWTARQETLADGSFIRVTKRDYICRTSTPFGLVD